MSRSHYRPIEVTDVRLAGTGHTGRFTREHLERSIALVREQAPRLKAYFRAVPYNPPYREEDRGEWMSEVVFINEDGSDYLRDDGTYVSPGGTVCGSEAYAIDDAVQSNVDAVDQILYRNHFLRDGYGRKKAYAFDKSPTLAKVLEGAS
jgi:hypothetical protein